HNISIQGGSEKTSYYVGFGYIHQEGLLDQVRDDLNKYNVNTKFTITAKEWLKFNFNNNVTLNLINRPLANQTILYNTISNTVPTRVTHLPTGSSEYSTPIWNEQLYLKQAAYQQNRVSDAMSFSTTITPLEGWEVVGEMKARLDVENNSFKLGKSYYAEPNGEIKEITGTKQGYQYPGMRWQNTRFGSYTRGNTFNYYLSPNLNTSYTHQWDDHTFKAMVGTQVELQENSNAFMYKDGMLSDDIYSFDNANGTVYAGEARSNWSTAGFFARFNWHYKNLYFVEVSGRYDGSSRFAKSNRWGLFPSFSAGYDIARADYFTALDLPISQLKARISYGRLGNQNGAGLYDYIGVMTLEPNEPGAWLLPDGSGSISQGVIAQTPKMISPYITWEKVDNANFGIDARLFKDRLT
ncbi:MAG: SusC/RagA family TonB-linked outer membrane protein, partial [Bacteroidales bacterium]